MTTGIWDLIIPAFSRRDLLQGITQNAGMVQADGSNHRNFRIDHVGGIQTATQSYLNGLEVHPVLGKAPEGHRRHEFKQ